MNHRTTLATAAAALALGLAACGQSGGEPQPTETVTETVEVTPQACLDALDYAQQGFIHAGEAMGISAETTDIMIQALNEAMTAGDVSAESVRRLEAVSAELEANTDGVNALAPLFVDAAAECRATAEEGTA